MGGASLYRSRAFADARRRYALRQPGAHGARRGGDVLDRLVRLVKGRPEGVKTRWRNTARLRFTSCGPAGGRSAYYNRFVAWPDSTKAERSGVAQRFPLLGLGPAHNVLSWYIRPLFLLPFCYFAYKRT